MRLQIKPDCDRKAFVTTRRKTFLGQLKYWSAMMVGIGAAIIMFLDLKDRYDSTHDKGVALQKDVDVLKVDMQEVKAGVNRLENTFGTRITIKDAP